MRVKAWLRTKFKLAILASFFTLVGLSASAFDIQSKQIEHFKIGSDQRDFGRLRFEGGILTWADERLYGAVSSIRFLSNKRDFLAVLDTGYFLEASVVRDANGRLSGISNARLFPILDENGKEHSRKYMVDSEGLALRGDQAIVSFEQRHRIEVYDRIKLSKAQATGTIPHLMPSKELRANGGIETLALSPKGSPFAGALIAVAEQSVDANGHLYAAILDGPLKGQFRVVKTGEFAVTDGAFLPNGDLILLERRFSLATGVGMRLRLISSADIKPNAIVDGEVLLDVGMAHQIDNMEGLDVVEMDDGSIHLFIVSDNNHSFLQRNLMLEFKLLN